MSALGIAPFPVQRITHTIYNQCAFNIPYIGLLPPFKTNKKLSYRRVTARSVLSVVILPIATQQCRNYLYDKS